MCKFFLINRLLKAVKFQDAFFPVSEVQCVFKVFFNVLYKLKKLPYYSVPLSEWQSTVSSERVVY